MPIQNLFIESPIGRIEIKASAEFINALLFTNKLQSQDMVMDTQESINGKHPLIQECARQLREYFTGKRMKFELPLQQKGTEFQQKVWNELAAIPLAILIVTWNFPNVLVMQKPFGR